ncbi:MAG TPA: DUF1294 domain-containing protein [Candidatus Faecousia faecipullorum]|nr:DUF1294 domain-containing protein [Candidatus Faecousia faecipullorum]
MNLFLVSLLIINAIGFFLMLSDKRRARKNLWRIPERTLLTVAALGGSLGCLAGMYAFRHKTRHPKFTIGIPAILLLQTALALYLLLR